MSIRQYVARLFGRAEPEPNSERLSMAELCIKYLPEMYLGGAFASGDAVCNRIETFGQFAAHLSDEQMYAHLTRNYEMSDKKAKAFVRDSKSFREDMQKLGELGDLVRQGEQ